MVFAISRAKPITAAVAHFVAAKMKSTTAVVSLVFIMLALLIYGISQFGLVNSLPNEKHVERNRENNKMIMTEDKDGCLDLRTLGRSNGVYLSLKPCKPAKKDE